MFLLLITCLESTGNEFCYRETKRTQKFYLNWCVYQLQCPQLLHTFCPNLLNLQRKFVLSLWTLMETKHPHQFMVTSMPLSHYHLQKKVGRLDNFLQTHHDIFFLKMLVFFSFPRYFELQRLANIDSSFCHCRLLEISHWYWLGFSCGERLPITEFFWY